MAAKAQIPLQICIITGLILLSGCQGISRRPTPPLAPLMVACTVNPTSVFPGDPVTATATLESSSPDRVVTYKITGEGGTANGAIVTINTASLPPGDHKVICSAAEYAPGKEPGQIAGPATATFTVKQFEPPTIGCTANPSTINPGENATITGTATSPQNRMLTHTYSASGGTITAAGDKAQFSSVGTPAGPVTISCNVADDKGHSSSSSTTITILAPPPPPSLALAGLRCSATPPRLRPGGKVVLEITSGLTDADHIVWTASDKAVLPQEYGRAIIDTTGWPAHTTGFLPQTLSFRATVTGPGGLRTCEARLTVDSGAPIEQFPNISQAAALLSPGSREGFGFAMYTYVLVRRIPTDKDQIAQLHSLVLAVLSHGSVPSDTEAPLEKDIVPSVNQPIHAQLQKNAGLMGVTYIPVRAPFDCARNRACDGGSEGEAHWIVEEQNYDTIKAQRLLGTLPCNSPDASPNCRSKLSGNGPFLITTAVSLSQNHPSGVLIQDLSGTDAESAGRWVEKYFSVASRGDSWQGSTLRLRLLDLGRQLSQGGATLVKVGGARAAVFEILAIGKK